MKPKSNKKCVKRLAIGPKVHAEVKARAAIMGLRMEEMAEKLLKTGLEKETK